MNEIKKIVIESMSGYGSVDLAYRDMLVLERNYIKYEYTPQIESIFNPVQKWKYEADSPIFEQTFEEVSAMMLELMKLDPGEVIYDIGGIDFTVTFEDKEKWKQSFYLLNNRFEDFFLLIKKMIPRCEKTPVVIMTEEDEDEDEDFSDEETL